MGDTGERPHGKDLRKGRVSLPNHAYLATIVTASRKPVFTPDCPLEASPIVGASLLAKFFASKLAPTMGSWPNGLFGFTSFDAARVAVRCFHDRDVMRHAQTLAFVVMPDHVHWLLQLEEQGSLSATIRLYKAKVSLILQQQTWQRGFHDHALRDEDDARGIARYIIANPLRSGLANSVGEYPHWDAIWL